MAADEFDTILFQFRAQCPADDFLDAPDVCNNGALSEKSRTVKTVFYYLRYGQAQYSYIRAYKYIFEIVGAFIDDIFREGFFS